MHQKEFQQHIGPKNMCASFADALHRAAELQGEMTDPEFRETKLLLQDFGLEAFLHTPNLDIRHCPKGDRGK